MDVTHRRPTTKQALSIALTVLMVISFLAVPGSVRPQNAGAVASYIVQGLSSDQAARMVEAYGGTVTSQLDIIDGVGALLTPQTVETLRKAPAIRSITPNGSGGV